MVEDAANFFFADDGAFLIEARNWANLDEKIKIVLDKVSRWCRQMGMGLSLEKTEIIFFWRDKNPTSYIKKYSREATRYLGIYIDKRLSFCPHIERITRKCAPLLSALRKLKHFICFKFRRSFMFSVIQNCFWVIFTIFALSDHAKSKIKKIYHKAARILTRVPDWVDIETSLKIGGLENFDKVTSRHASKRLISIDIRNHYYKSRNLKYAEWLDTIFTKIDKPVTAPTHSYNTRHKQPYTGFHKYTQPIFQNKIQEIVFPITKLNESPWRRNPYFFEDASIESILDVKTYFLSWCTFLDTDRKLTIKNSLYYSHLKNCPTIESEQDIISAFVESRRKFWNFDPIDSAFNLRGYMSLSTQGAG